MTQVSVFDAAADQYESIVNASLKITGATVPCFARQKAIYLRRFLHQRGVTPATILDVGCGVGILTNKLRIAFPNTKTIVGYDPSGASISVAQARYPNEWFVSSDLVLHQYVFDLVVVANVLHHIEPRGRADFLSRVGWWIAPKGHLAIFEHNPWNPITRRIVRDCPLDAGVKLIPPPVCTQMLVAAGFRPVAREFVAFFPAQLSWLRRLEPRLWWLPLGAQYAIVAQRVAP